MIYIRLLNNEEFIYEDNDINNMDINKLYRVYHRFTELSKEEAQNIPIEDVEKMRAIEYGFDTFNSKQNPCPLKNITFSNILYYGNLIEESMINHVFKQYKESLIKEE